METATATNIFHKLTASILQFPNTLYAAHCYKGRMVEDRLSLDLNPSTESALLVKTLLERHHHAVGDSPNSEMTTINWVAIKDFTVDVGKKQIGEYIQTWELQPCWLYSLAFVSSTDEEHRTFYHYQARFSTPTSRKPIQGTASVYFVVGMSKVKPKTLPVEVHFVVESNRLVHTPGRTRFRDKWLADVIESKTLLGREVDL